MFLVGAESGQWSHDHTVLELNRAQLKRLKQFRCRHFFFEFV
jgi:hypothetical protein